MKRLALPAVLLAQMLEHAASLPGEEVCGLVGGTVVDGVARGERCLPVENQLHSPTRFLMEAHGQLAAFLAFERLGLELVAIYHSHPNGPGAPSPTDLGEFLYPGVAYLILSPDGPGWAAKAFCLDGGAVTPLLMTVEAAGNE